MTRTVPVLAMTLLLVSSTLPAHAADPHVRTTSPQLRAVLDEGMDRSAIFRSLVEAIEASDVIVYLLAEPQRLGRAAHVAWLGAAGGRRYLKISIDPRFGGCANIAILGHELRHATEIAADRSVDSVDALRVLYRRIGFASCGGIGQCFDTTDAVDTGRHIGLELAGGSRR